MLRPLTLLETLYPLLFCRYARKDEGVIHLFGDPSWKQETFEKRINFLRKLNFPQGAGEHLQELNCKLLHSEQSLPGGQAEHPGNGGAAFVITGQQPGLFTGPLYVIYKALTAIKLAENLEEVLGIPVKPLFWVASEDHNIYDLTRIYIPVSKGGPVKVRYKTAGFGQPSGRVALNEEEVARTLSKLGEVLSGRPYKEEVLSALGEVSGGAGTFGDWFIRCMDLLFKKTGLLYCDPLRMVHKGLYMELLLQALEEGPLLHSLLDKREEKIRAGGYGLQVPRKGDESFIMMVRNGKRFQLRREDGIFRSPEGEVSFTKRELKELIRREPGSFGPNVLLRPVFQDCLFPNLAYVPGPAELNYYAQIRDLYEVFGTRAPPLYPRVGLTVVEPEISNILKKYKLNIEKVLGSASEYNSVPSAGDGPPAPEAEKLRMHLFPRGHPQERVMNIFAYIAEYGFSFFAELARQFPLEMGHHAFYWSENKNGA